MSLISWNGSIIPESDFSINVNNPGLRYGDGIFETIKARDGKLLLEDLHFERLFSSLQILKIDIPFFITADYLREQIHALLAKNGHKDLARIRLMICRNEGHVVDDVIEPPQILIQSWLLDEPKAVESLEIEIFPDARKSCDQISSLKSNNYLCYLLAARFAKDGGFGDAIVLNAFDRVAESSISNLFIVRENTIYTPPLSEGCIDGVYRKYLLRNLRAEGISVSEEALTIESLLEADEMFLTNAIRGIRPVDKFRQAEYKSDFSQNLILRLK